MSFKLPETDFGTSPSSRKSAPTRVPLIHPEMFPSPNDKQNVASSSTPSSSSVWSSPNIGQMTEMSQEWYRKMMTDGAELVKLSFEPQYKDIDFSAFITQSQPPPHIESNSATQSSFDDEIFPFNSLPLVDGSSMDNYSFLGGALLTPNPSSTGQITRPSSSIPNTVIPSPIRKHSVSSRGQLSRGRKYHNTNVLAQYCQEVLCKTAHPSIVQISEIVARLNYAGGPSEKKLKSLVREWFRKRREYMATKIYRSCQSILPPCPTESHDQEMSEFIRSIHSNRSLIGIIMLESKLPMESETEKIDFVKEKIIDYYLKYPQRKLRNCTGFKTCQGQADFDLFINQNYHHQ